MLEVDASQTTAWRSYNNYSNTSGIKMHLTMTGETHLINQQENDLHLGAEKNNSFCFSFAFSEYHQYEFMCCESKVFTKQIHFTLSFLVLVPGMQQKTAFRNSIHSWIFLDPTPRPCQLHLEFVDSEDYSHFPVKMEHESPRNHL